MKTIPVPINNANYAAWAASASVPTEQTLGDDSNIFIGGAPNVSLLASSPTGFYDLLAFQQGWYADQ